MLTLYGVIDWLHFRLKFSNGKQANFLRISLDLNRWFFVVLTNIKIDKISEIFRLLFCIFIN